MLVFNCDTELNFITVIGNEHIYEGDEVVIKTRDGQIKKGIICEISVNLNILVHRFGEIRPFEYIGSLDVANDVVIKTIDGHIINGNVFHIEVNQNHAECLIEVKMIEYELINSSVPYTFMAANKEVAALTVFCLSTAYGAKSKNGNEKIPVFIFGGSKKWYQKEFHRTPDDGLEAERENVANALMSFMYGRFEERRRYEIALNSITEPDKKKEFIWEWQNGGCIINDIGTYAHKLGEKMME